jgi:hypothetical protein
MEQALMQCRIGWNLRKPEEMPTYQAELDRLEARLAELLDDDDENPFAG